MKKYSKYLVLALLLITIVTITGVSAEDTSNYSSSDNTTLNSVNNNVNILTDDNVSDGMSHLWRIQVLMKTQLLLLKIRHLILM